MKNPRLFVILFAVSAGAVALGIITMAAYLTNSPLVFPPLAASAFILFYTPMSSRASPRNVVVAHTMALLLGLISLFVLTMLYPESKILGAGAICLPRVAAIALAMGLSNTVMISFDCDHPPAAATALIAAMGYVVAFEQILAFIAAGVLLVLEAFVLNRVLGGSLSLLADRSEGCGRLHGVDRSFRWEKNFCRTNDGAYLSAPLAMSVAIFHFMNTILRVSTLPPASRRTK